MAKHLNFYSCAVKMIEEDLDRVYDWSVDVMHDTWMVKRQDAHYAKNQKGL
jgi:hypothetical protein